MMRTFLCIPFLWFTGRRHARGFEETQVNGFEEKVEAIRTIPADPSQVFKRQCLHGRKCQTKLQLAEQGAAPQLHEKNEYFYIEKSGIFCASLEAPEEEHVLPPPTFHEKEIFVDGFETSDSSSETVQHGNATPPPPYTTEEYVSKPRLDKRAYFSAIQETAEEKRQWETSVTMQGDEAVKREAKRLEREARKASRKKKSYNVASTPSEASGEEIPEAGRGLRL